MNIQHSTFNIPVLCLLLASTAFANELSVDKRTVQLDDVITITVILEDAFASVDAVKIPLRNLVFDGPPSMSSEFEFINGRTSRRKTFRYVAHATAPGDAVVGPVTIRGSGDQVETLAPISIQVFADAAAGTNDPIKILREMIATNRDPIFVIAEVDKTNPFTGEEIIITWTLYNASSVQQYAISEIPKLEDFWTEELDVRVEQPQQVIIAGMSMLKLPIRRAALFPLRSGTLTIPSMSVNASIMKRIRTGSPFGLFEGMEVDVHRRAAPISVHARPIPPGPAVAAVGDFMTMRCGPPIQHNGGPVVLDVAMSGRANLRSVAPPPFDRPPGGTLQVIEKKLNVNRVRSDAWMQRQWQYLIFPATSGALKLPALSVSVLTSAGVRQQLRCEASTLMVNAATPDAPPPRLASRRPPITRRNILLFAVAVVLASTVIALTVARTQRSRRVRNRVRHLVKPTVPETRAAVDAYVASLGIEPAALMREPSDRGDAYRSLRSLLDALERERVVAGQGEIADRVRDLVIA